MEREHHAMITFFHDGPSRAGDTVSLAEDAAQHARVRRVAAGDAVRLIDGRGSVSEGSVASVGKRDVTVAIERVNTVPRPASLAVVVPVADRDRMLLAAEKCVELQVTSWHPVHFARSRSVSPRGEGERFREKVIARMRSALEQSGGAWLPEVNADVECADAWEAVLPGGVRFLLQKDAQPLSARVTGAPTAIAVGPEGGFEQAEIDAAEASGWIGASLGSSVLRFETALVAGAAVVRAMQLTSR